MATDSSANPKELCGACSGGARIGLSRLASLMWGRFLYRLAVMGFDMAILIGMAFLLVASVLAMGGSIRLLQATALVPLLAMVAATAIQAWRKPGEWKSEIGHILRDWLPFCLVVFIYENLHDVAGQVTGWDFAVLLNEWDIAIFGVEPTIWAQRIFSPLATDIFSISYATYLMVGLFLMLLLSLWDRREDFRHMSLAMTLTFLMGFVGYVFLPASPPRYFIEHLYTDPPRLYGLFLFDRLQGAWDGLSVISGGAFPSLHVALSAVALIYAFRFRNLNRASRVVWYAYVPLILSLWFSTVYLRHHWVIDIAAGILVAAAAYVGAEFLTRAWRGLRRRYGLPL